MEQENGWYKFCHHMWCYRDTLLHCIWNFQSGADKLYKSGKIINLVLNCDSLVELILNVSSKFVVWFLRVLRRAQNQVFNVRIVKKNTLAIVARLTRVN